MRPNMICKREDNLAWHPDFPPDMRSKNDFLPFAAIGEMIGTEFVTTWRHRLMDWDHACIGWGMHDGVPIHPIGSILIGELRMRGQPRQPGGDKYDIRIFPFDDLDMLLCDLPHNWNFQLCCWNDLCLEFLCDDIDHTKMPTLNEWRCKCMTFDDERHQFIHRFIMPVRVEEPDGFERCP